MDYVGIVVDDLAAATGVPRSARTRAAGRATGRGPLGGPHRGARWRPRRDRDAADPGRQRTTRADEVPFAVKPGRQPARAAEHAGYRHLTFAVEDIDAVVAGLRARGAE